MRSDCAAAFRSLREYTNGIVGSSSWEKGDRVAAFAVT